MKASELFEIREGLHPKCYKDDDNICSRADVAQAACKVYAFPAAKWRNGDCPMADNRLRETTVPKQEADKVRVGQQKQRRF